MIRWQRFMQLRLVRIVYLGARNFVLETLVRILGMRFDKIPRF